MATQPPAAPVRQVIESYGDGGFRISGIRYEGAVLVFPDQTLRWPAPAMTAPAAALIESLAPVLARPGPGQAPPHGACVPRPEILLMGCGPRIAAVPEEVRARLRAAGIVIEAMDTGAACRTYNLLLAEDRLVAAALIAV